MKQIRTLTNFSLSTTLHHVSGISFFVSLACHVAVRVVSLVSQAVPHFRGGRIFIVKPLCNVTTFFFLFLPFSQ